MTTLHIPVDEKKITYVRAQIHQHDAFEIAGKTFYNDLAKEFPELKATELGDTNIHAEYLCDFPGLRGKLGKNIVEPLFAIQRVAQPDTKKAPVTAISFESTILGPQLSRYLIINPTVPVEELVTKLNSYAGAMTARAILAADFYSQQIGATGFSLVRTITEVPRAYDDRTPDLNPTLPIGVIKDIEANQLHVVQTTTQKLKETQEQNLEHILARIPESLHAFRIDTNVRLLFHSNKKVKKETYCEQDVLYANQGSLTFQ